MLTKPLIAVIAVFGLTAWRDAGPDWPAAGPMPDEPGHASRYTYQAIDQGTRSYRPVEPMPWGDVNQRVAPASAAPPAASDATPKAQTPQNVPAPMEHDHH